MPNMVPWLERADAGIDCSDPMSASTQHLIGECDRLQLPEQRFLAKKGDVFVWHGALCHRGTPIKNATCTRLSLATHYSTVAAVPPRAVVSLPVEYTPRK